MSEPSAARQRAANAQADNLVDTNRVHLDGAPRSAEIENDPKEINRNKKTAPEPEAAHTKTQDPPEAKYHSGGGSRGLKGHTGSGKGPLEHQM